MFEDTLRDNLKNLGVGLGLVVIAGALAVAFW